jgi:hypothetical protein
MPSAFVLTSPLDRAAGPRLLALEQPLLCELLVACPGGLPDRGTLELHLTPLPVQKPANTVECLYFLYSAYSPYSWSTITVCNNGVTKGTKA